MEQIVDQIINNFDFTYMLVINILTYIIIKTIDQLNGKKKVPAWQKRTVLIISIFIVASTYLYSGYDNKLILINSSILAPVFWSWFAAPICNKLGVDYRKVDETIDGAEVKADNKNE